MRPTSYSPMFHIKMATPNLPTNDVLQMDNEHNSYAHGERANEIFTIGNGR